MSNELILKANAVSKSYKTAADRLHVLNSIDIEIKRGELAFVLGRSGSGKSTLLHILGGLDSPDKGLVMIDDVDFYRMKDKQQALFRNERIGFVFQFYHLLPELNVFENVALPALLSGRAKDEKVGQLLEAVGLTERSHHLPRQLSGGEMQRVAIARALINDPEIIFCDEPTGNLDEETAGRIYSLIRDLNERMGQTFCIVTHDKSVVSDNTVYYLRQGRINSADKS